MPLNLGLISRQVQQMSAHVATENRRERIESARQQLHKLDADDLRMQLRDRRERVPWLVGIPTATLTATSLAPDAPPDFTVIAADGSYIPPDRHNPVRYYVINTSQVVLTYGSKPSAELDADGRLFFEDEDLFLQPGRYNLPMEGVRLGIKMAVAEMAALCDAAQRASGTRTAVRDGSLILWALQSEEKSVQQQFLGEFLSLLSALRENEIPVAGYISRPGSRDVVNSLRVSICEGDPINCGECACPERTQDRSLSWAHVLDGQVFSFLDVGERSDLFQSESAILEQYGQHAIQFFYLNVGGEIVRIEVPQWVARGSDLLDLTHATIYDQCRRSADYPAYPPALQEAHEKAAITPTDRAAVEAIVEKALTKRGIAYNRSGKAGSKRRRTV